LGRGSDRSLELWNLIYDYGRERAFGGCTAVTGANIPVTVIWLSPPPCAGSPQQVEAMDPADWEIASHGLKWIDYQGSHRRGRKG